MKLNWMRGRKGERDRILCLTTDNNDEWFSIFKVALLVNQLAVNELKINKEKIDRTGNFFLKNSIIDSVEMAEQDIDWAEEKNVDVVLEWCRRWKLRPELIEPELRKIIQTTVREFENESKGC